MLKKKFMMLVSVVLVIAMIFTACSGNNSSKTSNDNAKTSSDDSKGKVHITYAQWGNDTETQACQAVADKFNKQQDKITVEVLKIDYDNYITKLNSMATAGELPDTAIMNEAGVLTFAQNNLLADISKMYSSGGEKPLDSIAFKHNGSTVAYSAANEILDVWYNIDLLNDVCQKQGLNVSELTPPSTADSAWTWDKFVDTACKLTLDVNGNNALSPNFDPNNVAIYGCSVNTLPWQLEVWCKSNGGGFYSADGKKCIINEPASVEAIQAVADLYLKYHCAPQPSTSTTGLSTSLGTEKIVMVTDGTWNVGTYLGPDAKFKYGVGVLPYFKDKLTICTGGPNVVFASTKHPEEAMTWLKWYCDETNNWDLIKAGTWMPILESWYTDAAKTDQWIGNENFPDKAMYKSAVVDYTLKYAKSTSWYYVSGTDVFNASLNVALSYIWNGDKTAKDAIDMYYNEMNGIFADSNK